MKNFWLDIREKHNVFVSEGPQISLLRAFVSDGTSANFLYRLTLWLAQHRLSPLALVFQWINKVINGCVIGAHAQFDGGFVLMHPIGVVINSKVRGGHSIIVESGVVIGDEKGKSPVLGNNIFIGAGAKILGGITIGSNVKIGANAVVVKDVPSNSTALGIPARVIPSKDTKERDLD